jgi:hypothetical protein
MNSVHGRRFTPTNALKFKRARTRFGRRKTPRKHPSRGHAKFGHKNPNPGVARHPRERTVPSDMKRVISLSEIFGHIDHPSGPCEIYVSGEAAYNQDSSDLRMDLDAQLRSTDLLHKETYHRVPWLPKPRTERESVDSDEARDAAREIFTSWVHQVRENIPKSVLAHA